MGKQNIKDAIAALKATTAQPSLENEFTQAVEIQEVRKIKGARNRIAKLLEMIKE